MSAHNPYPIHEGGFQGGPQARGGKRRGQGGREYYVPHEKVLRHETWREDNLFDYYGEDPNAPTVASRLLLVELLEDIHLLPIVDHPTVTVFNQGFNEYFKSFNHRLARSRV
ncbi:hypothetical protein M9H77_22734 [Catharanthus roseus]|uniref:Uncharacterized protein n=1 Tax=Catharanthus roseus TaxID=4058 RepID=A0ACC0AS15_CATRO|nr:hypothetical protein M9H77_22734 [Catharanthus roseus]